MSDGYPLKLRIRQVRSEIKHSKDMVEGLQDELDQLEVRLFSEEDHLVDLKSKLKKLLLEKSR